MEQYLLSHEVRVAWLLFVGVFFVVGLLETFFPRKKLGQPDARRWAGNGLLTVSQIAVTALLPFSAAALAVTVSRSPYGLLNGPRIPYALRFLIAIMALDLLRYLIHRMFHRIPALWRVHQVHHSDPDFDLTTGVRTHPGEVLVVQSSYLAAVALIAPPALAVVAIECLTGMHSLFSHANVGLPQMLDKLLRRFIVTPDIHRIHHSADIVEQNTNFGFLFPFWDHLFRTYQPQPVLGHDRMGIGLEELQDRQSLNPLYLLAMPFLRAPSRSSSTSQPTASPVIRS